MNILILGAGGREHALTWKIAQSKECEKLFVSPGNGGTSTIATNLSIGVNDFDGIKVAVQKYEIDLLVIGPEEPLVKGLVDFLKADPTLENLMIVGPDKAGAMLEGSKDFAKEFMKKYDIPTARAQVFTMNTVAEGKAFLETMTAPYVLKADGLAAGKGVIITSNLEEAQTHLEELLGGQFGEASSRVLIEEFLDGIELSVFVLTDGESYKILPEAKDYKRIGEGDTGLNTGGMGAVSPVGFADRVFMQKIEERIIKPTVLGIKQEGFDYRGFIFFGLIRVKNEPYVIEYNVRMGDPETEAVIPRIKSDLLPILAATTRKQLAKTELEFETFTATTVMLVSGGYPEVYEKGKVMTVPEKLEGVVPFHAGTTRSEGQLKTDGGRVMAITGLGSNMADALNKCYQAIGQIEWEGMNYRKDIGFDLRKLGQ